MKKIFVIGLLWTFSMSFAHSVAMGYSYNQRVDSRPVRVAIQEDLHLIKVDRSRLRQKFKSYSDDRLRTASIVLTTEQMYIPEWSWYRTMYEGIKNGLISAVSEFEYVIGIALWAGNPDMLYVNKYGRDLEQTRLAEILDERLEYRDLYSVFYSIGQVLLIFMAVGLVIGLPLLVSAREKRKKHKQEKKITRKQRIKITESKIEIVNNPSYTNLKKVERIKYLQNLKEQATIKLSKAHNELEREQNKRKDLPSDVAKYIKPIDTSEIEADIQRLECRVLAIDELVQSEVGKKQAKKPNKQYAYTEDDD